MKDYSPPSQTCLSITDYEENNVIWSLAVRRWRKPLPRNGGMASRISDRPHKKPIPVGPHICNIDK